MSIFVPDLFTGKTRVEIAIERIKQFEPSEGYFLAFSGGKDSVTLYRLAEMTNVKFDAHYNITTIDPPELLKFIKRKYPNVARDKPDVNMWDLIIKNGIPPTRNMRYCCRELKERGGGGRVVLTGCRWAESVRRKLRGMVETCFQDDSKTFVHPIIDWETYEVWEFIKYYNIDYCSLYDEGFNRLGCILCPYSSDRMRMARRWPGIAAKYIKTFDKVVELRKLEGKKCTWHSGQELFDWWLECNTVDQAVSEPKEGQLF